MSDDKSEEIEERRGLLADGVREAQDRLTAARAALRPSTRTTLPNRSWVTDLIPLPGLAAEQAAQLVRDT